MRSGSEWLLLLLLMLRRWRLRTSEGGEGVMTGSGEWKRGAGEAADASRRRHGAVEAGHGARSHAAAGMLLLLLLLLLLLGGGRGGSVLIVMMRRRRGVTVLR